MNGEELLAVSPLYIGQGDINLGTLHGFSVSPSKQCAANRYVEDNVHLTLPAILYAVARINADSSLLANLTLGMVIYDHCWNLDALTARSLQVAFSVGGGHSPVGIVGPEYSILVPRITPQFSLFEVPHISPSASSDDYSDRSTYPFFYRVVPPDRVFTRVIQSVLVHYNWSYAFILYEGDSWGFNVFKQTSLAMHATGFCMAGALMVTEYFTQEDYRTLVRTLTEDQRARVIINALHESKATKVWKALQESQLERRFIWVVTSSFNLFQLIPYADVLSGCFRVDYSSLVDRDLATYRYPLSGDNLKKLSDDLIEELLPGCRENSSYFCQNQILGGNFEHSYVPFHNRMVDSVYAFAAAVDALIANECPAGYLDKSVLRTCVKPHLVATYLHRISVASPTRTFRFDELGEVPEDFIIFQLKRDEAANGYTLQHVGKWRHRDERLEMEEELIEWSYFSLSDNDTRVPESVCGKPCDVGDIYIQGELPCCWDCYRCRENEIVTRNNTVCQVCDFLTWPDDSHSFCLTISPTFLTWPDPYALGLTSLAGAGSIVCLVVLATVLRSRDRRVIKGASWSLLTVILLGLLWSLVTVGFYIAPPTPAVCLMTRVGFGMSCTLVFAPLLVKTNRVYQVFRAASKLSRKVLMAGGKTEALLLTIIILTQAFLIGLSLYFWPADVITTMPVLTERYTELQCQITLPSLLINLSFNIFIMLVSSFFGFLTRKLPENFNESWYIFLSVSTTLFIWLAFLPTYFNAFYAYHQAALLALALILNSLVVLVCLFGPKVYALIYLKDSEIQISDFQANKK